MFENYLKLNFRKVIEFLLFVYLLSHAATAAVAAFLHPQCVTAQKGRQPRRRWQHGKALQSLHTEEGRDLKSLPEKQNFKRKFDKKTSQKSISMSIYHVLTLYAYFMRCHYASRTRTSKPQFYS